MSYVISILNVVKKKKKKKMFLLKIEIIYKVPHAGSIMHQFLIF